MPTPDYEGFVKKLTELSRKYGIVLEGDHGERFTLWFGLMPFHTGHYAHQRQVDVPPEVEWEHGWWSDTEKES